MSQPLKPASPKQVALLGRKLEVQLPQAYVDALVHYPFPLDSDLAEVVFYPDPQKVVEKNEYYRKEGFYGHTWPKHYLIIGGLGNFDLFFLDTTRKTPTVLVADHERSWGADHIVVKECCDNLPLPEWLKVVYEGWQQIRELRNES